MNLDFPFKGRLSPPFDSEVSGSSVVEMNLDCPVESSPSASSVSVISGPLRVNTIRNHSTSGMDISSTGMSLVFFVKFGFYDFKF